MHATSNPYAARLSPENRAVLDRIRGHSIDRFGYDRFRMEDPAPADPPTDPAPSDPPADPPADPKPTDSPWDDPAKARAEIERLRRENAADRTNAKTKAAQDAEDAVVQRLGKALGFIKDGDKDKVDPAQLAAKLTETSTSYTTLQREHQVLLSALDQGADHKALLDSRTFLAKVADLDPADAKFQSKVDAAVKTAVDENPKLKTGQAPGASGTDHSGGSGEDTNPANRAKPGQARMAAAYATKG